MNSIFIALLLSLLALKTFALFDSGPCGTDKTCFVTRDGSLQFSFAKKDQALEIELQATQSKWASISFSRDEYQGDDDVISCECEYSFDSPDKCDTILAKDLQLVGRSHYLANEIDANQNLCLLEAQYSSSTIYCKVKRLIVSADTEGDISLDGCHYQFYSAGQETLRLERKVIYDSLEPPLRSISCINAAAPDPVNNILVTEIDKCEFLKPHGIFIILAWTCIFPIAMFIWQYVSPTLGDDRVMWFRLHRVLLVVNTVLNVIGYVLFLVHSGLRVPIEYRAAGLWIVDFDMLLIYQVLGIVVLIFSIVIPIMSFFKCSKYKHPKPRFIFDICYAIVCYSALIISLVYIFIGLFLLSEHNCYYNEYFLNIYYPPARTAIYTIGALLGITSIIYFMMDIYHVLDERVEKDKHLYLQATNPEKAHIYDDEALGSDFYVPTDFRLRQAVFVFFVIVCVIGSVALSIQVGLS